MLEHNLWPFPIMLPGGLDEHPMFDSPESLLDPGFQSDIHPLWTQIQRRSPYGLWVCGTRQQIRHIQIPAG
jgi:hypothetical protein